MTPYKANPFVFIFSVIAIGVVLVYYIYGILDRTGLEESTRPGVVEDKQFTASGKSYYTTVSGGRTWVQSQETPETYAVVVRVDGARTAGAVPKQVFESLNVSDSVQVKVRRTRFTNRLEVIQISR